MSAKIYAEGGGEGQLLDTLFRAGWNAFFKAAGLKGGMPRVVRGKGREQTFDLFLTAVRNPREGDLPLLLVDSEGPVAAGHSVWQHLKARDGWDRPQGASDDQAFLMVQLMETWFLADRKLLQEHFGAALREKPLQQWPDLEGVDKDKVFKALDQATAGCSQPYSKGKVSYQLLARLNPKSVEEKCPHARALLERLSNL
ncbi:MAG: DUF4276 family protein [Acidobacteriota bacterium]